MFKLLAIFGLLLSVTLGLKLSHENEVSHKDRQLMLCLQELNQVIANHNGEFVSGEGFLLECRNENVFDGIRGGIILTAMCPDLEGNYKVATKFF